MRCRCVWWCIWCSAAAVVAQACSSDDTTGPSAGNDSGTGSDATAGGDAAAANDSASRGVADSSDASAPMTCDASVVTTMNACIQCATMNCSMQLAMCSADCACAEAETCALTLSNVFILSKCPNAVNAGFNNQPFMNINGCLAQYCLNPCSHVDAGSSEGGSADSGAADSSASDAIGE